MYVRNPIPEVVSHSSSGAYNVIYWYLIKLALEVRFSRIIACRIDRFDKIITLTWKCYPPLNKNHNRVTLSEIVASLILRVWPVGIHILVQFERGRLHNSFKSLLATVYCHKVEYDSSLKSSLGTSAVVFDGHWNPAVMPAIMRGKTNDNTHNGTDYWKIPMEALAHVSIRNWIPSPSDEQIFPFGDCLLEHVSTWAIIPLVPKGSHECTFDCPYRCFRVVYKHV